MEDLDPPTTSSANHRPFLHPFAQRLDEPKIELAGPWPALVACPSWPIGGVMVSQEAPKSARVSVVIRWSPLQPHDLTREGGRGGAAQGGFPACQHDRRQKGDSTAASTMRSAVTAFPVGDVV